MEAIINQIVEQVVKALSKHKEWAIANANKELYQNGKIYKLTNKTDGKIYVGSTCKPLRARFSHHKDWAKRKPHRRVYQHLNEVGWDKVEISLVEEFPCNSRQELEKRERHWIHQLRSELNKNKPASNPLEKYRCYCGGRFCFQNMRAHKNTQRHRRWIRNERTWLDKAQFEWDLDDQKRNFDMMFAEDLMKGIEKHYRVHVCDGKCGPETLCRKCAHDLDVMFFS